MVVGTQQLPVLAIA